MRSEKISRIAYAVGASFLLMATAAVTTLGSNNAVYAHTFSANESVRFLALTEQMRDEAQLAVMNLQQNNVTLAQAHANNAIKLLENGTTLSEVREPNDRLAPSLDNTLKQLLANISAASSSANPGTALPPQTIQAANQSISSLNDTIGEATTVGIDQDQRNNSTTWALTFVEILDSTLKNYGNATGASFDLTNMAKMASMTSSNATNSTTSMSLTEMAGSTNNNMSGSMTMPSSSSMQNSTMGNMTTKIANQTSYQTSQFLANKTLIQIFNLHLKPLANASLSSSSGAGNASAAAISQIENGIMELKDKINDKAAPMDVMMTVHTKIHPSLIQAFGLKTTT